MKLEQLHNGDLLRCDTEEFGCLEKDNIYKVYQDKDGDYYIKCQYSSNEGSVDGHYLDGNVDDESNLIGFSKVEEYTKEDIESALQDSAYLAGLKAGWNCGINNDRSEYERIIESRKGYLEPITQKRKING